MISNSQQEFAALLLETVAGRRIIAIACQQSLAKIRAAINSWALDTARRQLSEMKSECDLQAKNYLLSSRQVMDPIRKLYSECPPQVQVEIVRDISSIFSLSMRQAEAVLYAPRQETQQQRQIPAPRRLGGNRE